MKSLLSPNLATFLSRLVLCLPLGLCSLLCAVDLAFEIVVLLLQFDVVGLELLLVHNQMKISILCQLKVGLILDELVACFFNLLVKRRKILSDLSDLEKLVD